MSVDKELVRRIQATVGERLQAEQQHRKAAGSLLLVGEAERQYARHLISGEVQGHSVRLLAGGVAALDWGVEQELGGAVFARLYGAGNLQHLLDDERVENIDINGCDEVWVTYADDEADPVCVDPVADSDEELVEMVQTLASTVGLSSRPFDASNPELDLRLPDGSRLSAIMCASERPVLSIRRHRFAKVALADLVGNGTMCQDVADFLAAAVRARTNLMIAGATNSGKTTLLRALAAEIGPGERIITVERALELGIAADKGRHPNAVAFEERLTNSEGEGAITMQDLVRRTLRMNPDRVIVGEVLGPEIVTMLNAMNQGNDGSLSTIHVRSALQLADRIATYAIQAEEKLPAEAAMRLMAGGLDFIVFVNKTGTRRRVESIREINGLGPDAGVATSEIFYPDESGQAVRAGDVAVHRAPDLEAAGWVEADAGWGVF